jgi:DNA-binding LacI/PurR family transcriptional regulator
MRTSIRQVAQYAGVSPKTVSNVLRGRDARTSPLTRQRVLDAVRELNYVPVRAAVQNRHVETHVIGLYFGESDITRHFVGLHTFEGIRQEADLHGYDLLILGARPQWVLERQEMQFLDRRSDGFILITPPRRTEIWDALVRHEIPSVVCSHLQSPPQIPWVVPDNAGAMRQAVQYLAARGHRKIAHFAGQDIHSDAKQRRLGFEAAMRELGLSYPPEYIVRGSWAGAPEKNPQAAAEILRLNVSAVVCSNDGQALLLWKMAEEKGMSVPGDLSIIGMDDTTEAAQQGLSTLATPFEAMGRAAVGSLLGLLNGEDAHSLCRVVPVELVERRSVRRLREFATP